MVITKRISEQPQTRSAPHRKAEEALEERKEDIPEFENLIDTDLADIPQGSRFLLKRASAHCSDLHLKTDLTTEDAVP